MSHSKLFVKDPWIKIILIVLQLANCEKRLFMMPTMSAIRMFLHIRRGAGSEEIRSERGQQCDSNQTKRPGSFGSQREICHARMHAWQWRHVDSTVCTLQNSSLHGVWSMQRRSKEAWQIKMHCVYIHDVHFNRVSYWLGKYIGNRKIYIYKGNILTYKRNTQKYHCYFGRHCLRNELKNSLKKKIILFRIVNASPRWKE